MAKSLNLNMSQPVRITEIPAAGLDVAIAATPAECAELAELLELPAVKSLTAALRLTRKGVLVRVKGRMEALATQTCVVTLDPFDEALTEEIEVDFSEDAQPLPDPDDLKDLDETALEQALAAIDFDAPEPIIDGRVDLGHLLTEYLAVGLDPYPRKPGVVFEPDEEPGDDRPFAALAKLVRKADKD